MNQIDRTEQDTMPRGRGMYHALPIVTAKLPMASMGCRRPAWTLIEVLIATTLTSALTGFAITALITVQKADRSLRYESAHLAEAGRLAEAFRRDAHQAEAVVLGDDSRSVTFTLPNGATVGYERDGSQVGRVQEPSEDNRLATTVYRIDERIRLHFHRAELAGQTIVRFALDALPQDRRVADLSPALPIFRADAVLGRNATWILGRSSP